jgi:transposase
MWIPPEEKDPIVLQEPTRFHISVFGAVNVASGQFIHQMSETFNAATFLDFLKKILSHRKGSKVIHLILDNSRYHHAKLLEPWLREHEEIIRLDFLPPYSPQLNPIERVWKQTRRKATHNQYFSALLELICAVQTQFSVWSIPNDALAQLCSIS